MNKLNTFKKLFLLFISISIFSCTSDTDNTDSVNLEDDYIVADFIIDVGFIDAFSIKNHIVSYITKDYSSSFNSLNQIDENGVITVLDEVEFELLGLMGITNSNSGAIYYVSNSNSIGNKIYYYSTNTTSTYTMTPTSSPWADSIRMHNIENFGDDTYIVFDNSTLTFKRYFPSLNTDIFIAGSGESSIIDGEGLNASFKSISKILSVNEVIYIIDDSNNIRKIEKNGNTFTVTTLVANYNNEFSDLSVDSNDNLLVLIQGEGIYKLNNSNNTLEEYLTGEVKIKNDNNNGIRYSVEWGYFSKFVVDSNNIYLKSSTDVIKISDFESKI